MTSIEITHTVTLAGSAAGFAAFAGTWGYLFFKHKRKFAALRKKKYLVPYFFALAVMVLASACQGGLLGLVSGFSTGAGNQAGTLASRGMVGGTGAVAVAQEGQLTFSGSWIALIVFAFACAFCWFAKNMGERVLMISGAFSGATWGLSISLGGLAAYTGVPLSNWLGALIIG
ncbi:hypothetical protein AB0F71_31095 [Kitasatospora sp. NPDC028055]|jgi:hypothetical protein|uniref:hypothetical protein n=1 Tax=Kitasatospora sp. NPDC028055 TaxID=3155653 RepID=UPI0033DB108A